MRRPVVAAFACGSVLALGACAATRDGGSEQLSGDTTVVATTSTVPETAPPTAEPSTTTTSTTTTTTSPTRRSTTTTSTTAPRRTTTTTTTTTTAPPLPVHNPDCVIEVQPGDSLSVIVERIDDEDVNIEGLQIENGITDRHTIHAGDYLDICVGNEIDDITGDERVPEPLPEEGGAGGTGVVAQQQKLNELFGGTGIAALAVDGDSGPVTQQRLCAARVALGLPISRANMEPGSDEEQALMAAGPLPVPSSAPTSSGRWALVDRTCQIMFVGDGDHLVFVFQASTGEPGYETRDQNASRVFRYRPASDNNGWHNSSDFPAPEDNPLNGNMYRPLYFDRGQAIHGANNVPTSPASKGCVRLRVENQDALIDWLGLRDLTDTTSDSGHIGLSVSVQGQY